jgi:hypothetical protein
MDFGEYLLFTHRLKIEEYFELRLKQNSAALLEAGKDSAGFFSKHLDDVEDLAAIRLAPFGDVLQSDPIALEVLQRAKMHLAGLIDEWQQWHLRCLEPICTYSLSSRIGQEIYKQQEEKKLVGRYVAEHLVRDGDNIAIPEGSSALYAGLGTASACKNVRVTTSNDPLIREYRDNPAVARRFRRLDAIGGEVDFAGNGNQSRLGGVFGPTAEEQFHVAILSDPGATAVIMPVSGFLPENGPFAEDGDAVRMKRAIIEDSLKSQVRELIFVADYTKHLESMQRTYGVPVYSRERWHQLLGEHMERVSIVTAPPPALRKLLREHKLPDVVERHVYRHRVEFSERDKEYDRAARQFALLTRAQDFASRFREAYE